MILGLRLLTPLGASVLFAIAPALGADYDPPIVMEQPLQEVPVEIGNGWYLRGDIGYNVSAEPDGAIDFSAYSPVTGIYSPDTFDSVSFGEGMTFSGGFGYNFTDMFRADFTVDGFRMPFDATRSSAAPCVSPAVNPAYFGTGCRFEDGASASAIGLMVNGYVDLGTYVGFTPYVGAGVGYTYVDWSSLGSTGFCTGSCPGSGPTGSVTSEGEQSWRFTYAAMAGVAYDITSNLKIDVGYRYRQIDSGPMFTYVPSPLDVGSTGVDGDDTGFTTHEVRVGLRYSLW